MILNDNTYLISWICFKNTWCSAYVLATDSLLIRTWCVLILFLSSVQLVHPVAHITHCCNYVTTQRIQICAYNSILYNIFNKNNMLHIWIYEYVSISQIHICEYLNVTGAWVTGGLCVYMYAQWQRSDFLVLDKMSHPVSKCIR